MEIPKQLQTPNFRFIILHSEPELRKVPIEENWQTLNNYRYDDSKLLAHMKKGGNIGIVGGYGNLRIMDIDDPKTAGKLLKELNTFTVLTGGGGNHFYLLSDYSQNHVFAEKRGELRAYNYQVVCPGCLHPNGGTYTVVNDVPIMEVPSDELKAIITPLLKMRPKDIAEIGKTPPTAFEDADDNFIKKNIFPMLPSSITDLIVYTFDEKQLKAKGFSSRSERDQKVITFLVARGFAKYVKSVFELYPIGDKFREHTSGIRYLETSVKNARDFTGMMDDTIPELENYIDATHPATLRNKMDILLERLSSIDANNQGYLIAKLAERVKIREKLLWRRFFELQGKEEAMEPVSIAELLGNPFLEVDYWLQPLIPKGALILMGGKPGTFKSMFMLALGLSLGNKQKFLGQYEASGAPSILLYDLENDKRTIYWRTKYILKGLDGDAPNTKNFFYTQAFAKNDMKKELKRATGYDIIILDSYRRFLKGEENASEITNAFFNGFLKPLKDAGKTIIIVHHFRKAKPEQLTDEDVMDMFRGSSDIPAQFDLIMGIFKSQEKTDSDLTTFEVTVTKAKNRMGLPIQNFTFRVEKDDALRKTTFEYLGLKELLTPSEQLTRRVLDILIAGERGKQEILRAMLDVSVATVSRKLKDMVELGMIIQEKYGCYRLPEDNQKDLKGIFRGG